MMCFKIGPRHSAALLALTVMTLGAGAAQASFQDLLVSNLNNGTVTQYDPTTGAPLGTFATGLSIPRGIVVGPDHNVYVDDIGTSTVQKFDGNTGAPLGTFVTSGSGGLSFPYGMAFLPNGNLLVASTGTNSVLEYSGATGSFLTAFASGNGLAAPVGITLGPDGNLYVASSGNNEVYKFDGTTGAFLGVFASGNGLNGPSGLAFGNGLLYVANGVSGSHTISMFDALTGAPVGIINDSHISTPGGIAVGADSRLYVSSFDNNQVDRFTPAGSFFDVFATANLNGPIYLSIPGQGPATPEPASLSLLAMGAAGLAGLRWRRRMRADG